MFAAEGAVDPGEGLHEQGTLERPVEVKGVQGRGVEAGKHHVLDDHQLDLIIDVGEAFLNYLVFGVAAHVVADRLRVGGIAGIDDLDAPLGDVVVVPLGSQPSDLGVEAP